MKNKKVMSSTQLNARLKASQGIKLDIACGEQKENGWVGIDILDLPGVDIIHDIETFPWPLPDDCAKLVKLSHVVEHINPAKFGFVNFMNELWRVTKPGGQVMIACPYAGSDGFHQDPTHCNPINNATWYYFDPLHESKLYHFYRPRPWEIKLNAYSITGNMEVLLEKRLDDPSYGKI